MRYEIITDIDKYVSIIHHTNNPMRDIYELDLSQYDLDKIKAYKLVGKELIFDEDKWNEIIEAKQKDLDNKEINLLQKQLNESDYIVARAFEEVMQLANPLTFVADLLKITLKYSIKYKEVIKNRKTWRERIEELRNGRT